MSGWTADGMPAMDGRTVVVTGANSGLGYEGTTAFADAGATVVMACRSEERGERAAAEIHRAVDAERLWAVSKELTGVSYEFD